MDRRASDCPIGTHLGVLPGLCANPRRESYTRWNADATVPAPQSSVNDNVARKHQSVANRGAQKERGREECGFLSAQWACGAKPMWGDVGPSPIGPAGSLTRKRRPAWPGRGSGFSHSPARYIARGVPVVPGATGRRGESAAQSDVSHCDSSRCAFSEFSPSLSGGDAAVARIVSPATAATTILEKTTRRARFRLAVSPSPGPTGSVRRASRAVRNTPGTSDLLLRIVETSRPPGLATTSRSSRVPSPLSCEPPASPDAA